jgi:hypothetical protein
LLAQLKLALESEQLPPMNLRSEIAAQFQQVAQEQDLRLAPLTDSLELVHSGLNSLCFAIIVMRLETELGFDPFSIAEDASFPVTFGDFVDLYQNAANTK